MVTCVVVGGIWLPFSSWAQTSAASADTIAQKKQEIEALNEKIEKLHKEREQTAAQTVAIDQQVEQLKRELKAAELELKKTEKTVQLVGEEVTQVIGAITDLKHQQQLKKEQLKALVRELYATEQVSFIHVWFSAGSLSQAVSFQLAYRELQRRVVASMAAMRTTEQELQDQHSTLSDRQQELQSLQQALFLQADDLAQKRHENEAALTEKKKQQKTIDAALLAAQQARSEIEQDLFTLRDAGIRLSFTEAKDMATYAGKLTGVRAALLLAVLKVESNVGNSIGTGHYPDDMHPAQHEAFLRLTKKLNLDPQQASVSARPTGYGGWGGALGPGQFMPTTWEYLEPQVEKLMGKTPNPYELTDAFVATAIYLGERGATNPATEREAVGRYVAGPNWMYHPWYIDRVMAVAGEYEKEGLP